MARHGRKWCLRGWRAQASKVEHQDFFEIDNTTVHTHGNHMFRSANSPYLDGARMDQSNLGGTLSLATFTISRSNVPTSSGSTKGHPASPFPCTK